MNEKKVTIIVPIYNVEKYLNRCLESIVNQTYKNLEIILIDDGSPDSCPMLCDEWAKKDNRIKVIHKKNDGLGMARNTGIDNATGDYIYFCDSDDYIELETIEIAVSLSDKTGTDLTIFGFFDVDRVENKRVIEPFPPKNFYTGKEVQEDLLPELISSSPNINLMLSACLMLFSKKLIEKNDWRFVSERKIISEDAYSLINLFSDVESVNIISKAFYNYCRNEESLTRRYREDRFEKIKNYYDECIRMCKEHKYNNKVLERVSSTYFSYMIAAMKQIIESNLKYNEKYRKISNIVKDYHLQQTIRKINSKKENNNRKLLINLIKIKNSLAVFLLIWIVCIKRGK